MKWNVRNRKNTPEPENAETTEEINEVVNEAVNQILQQEDLTPNFQENFNVGNRN